jgi:hypothetical protein
LKFTFSETLSDGAPSNVIGLFLDGAHLPRHWFEYDPDAMILSDTMLSGEEETVIAQYRLAD